MKKVSPHEVQRFLEQFYQFCEIIIGHNGPFNDGAFELAFCSFENTLEPFGIGPKELESKRSSIAEAAKSFWNGVRFEGQLIENVLELLANDSDLMIDNVCIDLLSFRYSIIKMKKQFESQHNYIFEEFSKNLGNELDATLKSVDSELTDVLTNKEGTGHEK